MRRGPVQSSKLVITDAKLCFACFAKHALRAVPAQRRNESGFHAARKLLRKFFASVFGIFELCFQLLDAPLQLLILANGKAKIFLKQAEVVMNGL